ncbi:uncharacterized protein LOC135097885 isoform X4 [Scylla paramamosain]|uniref:uncharacterized protein LOC135097885 isoform X4 n=1 Tax=Scylla paramamosain TaxID=85552 RepID=UPI003083E0B9
MDPFNPEVKKEDDIDESSPSTVNPDASLYSQCGILRSIKEESEERENYQFMDEVKEEIDIKIEEEEVPSPDDSLMLCSQERPSLKEDRGKKRANTENNTQKIIISTYKTDWESRSAKRFKDLKEATVETNNSGDMTHSSSNIKEPLCKKRRPNFSKEELLTLISAVRERWDVIAAPVTPHLTGSMKEEAWKAVTAEVNIVSHFVRNITEIRSKFADFKSITKKKIGQLHREQTSTVSTNTGATMVQWDHGCFRSQGVFRHMDLNPSHGPRVGRASTQGGGPRTLPKLTSAEKAVAQLLDPQAVKGMPRDQEVEEVVTVLDEEGNMEQYVLPCYSGTLATMADSSLPSSPQPGPSQQSHHLPFSLPEVQPTSLHTLPIQPSTSLPSPSLPQAAIPAADPSRCETPLSTPSPPQAASSAAGPSRDVAPLPSSSPPKVALPAAGPSRRHRGRLDGVAVPQMVEIQKGILSETRNIRASLDRIGDQLEVMNSTFSSHVKAMTTVLEVIANSLAKIASKKK